MTILLNFKAVLTPLFRSLRALRYVAAVSTTFALAGSMTACADTRYYLQALSGHLQMMQASRPVEQWLADDAVTPALKQRLALALRIRGFAVTDLKLPDNASYH